MSQSESKPVDRDRTVISTRSFNLKIITGHWRDEGFGLVRSKGNTKEYWKIRSKANPPHPEADIEHQGSTWGGGAMPGSCWPVCAAEHCALQEPA